MEHLWVSSTKYLQDNATTISTLIGGFSFAFFGFYHYFNNIYSFWEKKGIKGPKPLPIVGNTKHLLVNGREKIEEEWAKKYGAVYGIYYGSAPRLVISDLEVVNQICIKDFDVFIDHYTSEFFNKYQKSFIVFQQGDSWRRMRAFMSPTFTSGKIKKMFKFLDLCAEDLIEYVKEEQERQQNNSNSSNLPSAILNGKELYNLFTMDAITTCCYSLKLERANSPNLKSVASRNEFVKIAMSLFKFNFLRILAVATFPTFLLRLLKFELTPEAHLMPLINIVDKMIEKRRKEVNNKYDDYLQSLIDAKLDDKIELNEMDDAENHHAGLSKETILKDQEDMVERVKQTSDEVLDDKKKNIQLTDIEIITAASFLLLVGLETTGNLLCNCSYLLAYYQDIQEKLYKELSEIAERDSEGKCFFSYETLTSCKYLDAVICETLRTYTPSLTGDRYTSKDYYIEKYKLLVPKGTVIHIPFHVIMNDQKNFENPHKFDPERFMPGQREKIKPGAYCPFGLGPRHCIGMRFSLTEAKLALAKIIMQFKFEPAPEVKFPPESILLSGLIRCIKDPRVKFVSRN